jgi:hypothetical protein
MRHCGRLRLLGAGATGDRTGGVWRAAAVVRRCHRWAAGTERASARAAARMVAAGASGAVSVWSVERRLPSECGVWKVGVIAWVGSIAVAHSGSRSSDGSCGIVRAACERGQQDRARIAGVAGTVGRQAGVMICLVADLL